MKLSDMVAQYAVTGSLPSPPPVSVKDLLPNPESQERLCRIVEQEGDEAVRYLAVEAIHTKKVEIAEYARLNGLEAARAKYRNPRGANPPAKPVLLSVTRIAATACLVLLLGWLKYKQGTLNFVSAACFAGGAQALIEFWMYSKKDILSQVFSWWGGHTKPQIFRDAEKLGKLYLNGFIDVAELNGAIGMARAIQARCDWDLSPRITIGNATGLLRAQGVASGAGVGVPLALSLTDLCTSMIIIGGTGSGKIQHLNALLTSVMGSNLDASIIAMDPKRSAMYDNYNILASMPEEIRKSYKFRVIGPDDWECSFNPIDAKVSTPEEVSATLLDAIHSEGGGSGDSEYWSAMTVDLVYSACHLLDLAGVPRDLGAVNELLTNVDALETILALAESAAKGDPEKEELLAKVKESVRVNLTDIPEKTRGNILSSISSWIGRFSMPSMKNFRSSSISLADLVDEKCLFIVDIPERYGKPGRLLRYFIFRQIYDIALSRVGKGKDRHIIMVCDEVQESTNQYSFRKSALSREGKLALIAATQSRSQLITSWGGKEAADTVLANFRSRVLLSTDDPKPGTG
jgi:hypothetical protein